MSSGTVGRAVLPAAGCLLAALALAGLCGAAENDLLWMRTYDGPAHGNDEASGVATDVFGNLYVAGHEYRSDLNEGYNSLLIKYLPDGSIDPFFGVNGMVSYNSIPYGDDRTYGVAVAPDGSIYVAGITDTVATYWDAWLRKISPAGAVVWTKTYDSPAHSNDYYFGVAVDSQGNVAAVGTSWRGDIFEHFNWVVHKYDSSGNLLWERSYNGPAGAHDDEATSVAFAPNGDVVVAGYETQEAGDNLDIAVRRYDAAGNLLWHRRYGSETMTPLGVIDHKGNDQAFGVTVDSLGEVYVTGYVEPKEPTNSKTDVWTRKYSADGNHVLWTQRWGAGNREFDGGTDCDLALAGAGAGRLYVAGYSRCQVDACNQGYNLLAQVYDQGTGLDLNREMYDSGNYPDERDERGVGVAVDLAGNYTVAGWQESQTDLRATLASGVVGDKIYVLRGAAPGGGVATVEEYDPAHDRWRARASMNVVRNRVAFGVAVGKIYAVGGYGPGGVAATVEMYDPAANVWMSRAAMTAPRSGVAAAVVSGKVYAIGGTGLGGVSAAVEMYDPVTDSWTPKAGMAVPRYEPAAAEVDGKIYVIGGGDGSSTVYASVEMYDPGTNTWTPRAAMPTPRSGHVALVRDGKIYAIGGINTSGYLKAVEMYDPAADTWYSRKPMSKARAGVVGGVVGGRVFAIGGADGSGNLPTVEEFTATVGSWTKRSDLPAECYVLAVAAAGGSLIAVGGFDGSGFMDTTFRYDPAGNSWVAKTSMSKPRGALAAVEYGGLVYAIGGFSGTAYQATVEVYDPTADTWAAKADMITPREFVAACVANGKIYAMGGRTQTGCYVPTVEEYDPVADTWTARADMPTARAGLAAASVGGLVYAIGGGDDFTAFTAVEEYNPATDTWTARADMPTGRVAPAAGAIDGRIYVAGGSGAADMDSLESYDPAANTWATWPDLPTPRTYLDGAVLGGMLYAVAGWGGGLLPTVESYDPLSGSWQTRGDMLFNRGKDWVVRKYSGPVAAPRGLEFLKVYPNPYRPADAVNGTMKFGNLPLGATVRIYTIRGYLVRKLIYTRGEVLEWDGRNEDGEEVATGVYMYTAGVEGRKPVKGKFAVVR